MYDPYAVDRLHIERDLVRHHLATTPRRPEAVSSPTRASADSAPVVLRLRLILAGLVHRSRPATGTCTNC
jgi:hypothetical protein